MLTLLTLLKNIQMQNSFMQCSYSLLRVFLPLMHPNLTITAMHSLHSITVPSLLVLPNAAVIDIGNFGLLFRNNVIKLF